MIFAAFAYVGLYFISGIIIHLGMLYTSSVLSIDDDSHTVPLELLVEPYAIVVWPYALFMFIRWCRNG